MVKNYQENLINDIKTRIPKGCKVYLDGHYKDEQHDILWWYVWQEEGIVWIEFESDDGLGRGAQHAEDFDEELLESVLESITGDTIPDSVPVGKVLI